MTDAFDIKFGSALPERRHVFDRPQDIPARQSITGLNQTERCCTLCPVIKVTVHEAGGGARREWRPSKESLRQGVAPIECTGAIGVAR